MSEHSHHSEGFDDRSPFERHCDVAVVGGSAAGLAAALQLGRQRRSVIVVDSGEPRNAPAAHMHGYLSREGISPAHLTATGREEVRSYGCEVLRGRAIRATRTGDDRFQVELDGARVVVARRLLVATGLVDQLPDIDGLAEHWGRDVIHCPFCHGYEVRDRRLVQIVTHPSGLHATPLLCQLTEQLTVVLHGQIDVDPDELDTLRTAGVTVLPGRVERIAAGPAGRVTAVEVSGHGPVPADAVAIGPRFAVRTEAFAALGLQPAPHPTGLGDFVETDATGQTPVAGVYAAGNVTDPSQQVLQAAAQGSRVGAMISFSLAEADVRTASRASSQESDWDQRYGGAQLWSGNPNGSLIQEIAGLEPGRALDVGAGEGGDAIWLAEQGWAVTASDISGQALSRTADGAAQRGVRVDCRRADANGPDPFDAGAYDLVSAQYASIPRTPDGRGVSNLLAAVAPGGLLLVVSHDLEAMRAHGEVGAPGMAFDPDAYVRIDDVIAALDQSPEWEVEVNEKRPRPAGAASAAHHADDLVLRARKASAALASVRSFAAT